MNPTPPPDWRLPTGVNRGLWDYLHDPGVARNYEDGLRQSPLADLDLAGWGYRVLGVDLSAEMLAVASGKAAREGLRVDLLRANLAELDGLAGGSFDYVVPSD